MIYDLKNKKNDYIKNLNYQINLNDKKKIIMNYYKKNLNDKKNY